MANKRVGKYPKSFIQMAVACLKHCDNISEPSKELGVNRRLLYVWRDRVDRVESVEEPPPVNSLESTLRKEVRKLKRVLAEETVEADFFNGALQKVKARQLKPLASAVLYKNFSREAKFCFDLAKFRLFRIVPNLHYYRGK